MKTIGEIAYLILANKSSKEIETSMCWCVKDLLASGKINDDEAALFNNVIAGWQAVGSKNGNSSAIYLYKEDGSFEKRVTEIHGAPVKNTFDVFIRQPFEAKRQWLVNLALMM